MKEDILSELHDLSNHVLFVNERAIGKIASLSVDNDRLRQQIALLLGALNQMVRHHDQLTPEDIKQAKDAIAKATGGE